MTLTLGKGNFTKKMNTVAIVVTAVIRTSVEFSWQAPGIRLDLGCKEIKKG